METLSDKIGFWTEMENITTKDVKEFIRSLPYELNLDARQTIRLIKLAGPKLT